MATKFRKQSHLRRQADFCANLINAPEPRTISVAHFLETDDFWRM